MEALTSAEARVLQALLGAEGIESEGARRARVQVPRSTYQEAKRRLYEEGWIEDRYVPDPAATGISKIALTLAQPEADARARCLRALEADRRVVVLWAGVQSLLVARFLGDGQAADDALAPLEGNGSSGFTVLSRPDQVPIYFDFEGSWSTLDGMPASTAYPRPLTASARLPGTASSSKAMRALVARPFEDGDAARYPPRTGAFFLPRSQRRVLSSRGVVWRVFPRFGRSVVVGKQTLRHVVIVMGELRTAGGCHELLAALAERCHAHPFLAAHDDVRVLLGFLGLGLPSGPRTSPGEPRPSVQGVIEKFATHLRIVREDVSGLQALVDHRYDRLFS